MLGPVVYIDGESCSLLDLKKVGASRQWVDPSTRITVACWRVGPAGPTRAWVPHFESGPAMFAEMKAALDSASRVVAFGSFEREWFRRYGIFVGERYDDLQARALYASMPARLDTLCEVAKSPYPKDMKGNALIKRMARPRKVDKATGGVTWWHLSDPDKMTQAIEYCMSDIAPMVYLDSFLPVLPEPERRTYWLDQKANDIGVPIDVPSVTSAVTVLEGVKERLDAEFLSLIGDEVSSPRSPVKLREWFGRRGYPLTGVGKEVLEALVKEGVDDPLVSKIIDLRLRSSRSSTAKLEKMRDSVHADGRIRGTGRWHGAHTGRKSHLHVQFGNFPRGNNLVPGLFGILNKYPPPVAAWVLETIYGSVYHPVADSLRGFIRAPAGEVLVGCDQSQIEARVLAWLGCDEWVLEVFRGDGKLYEAMAAAIFKVPIEQVTSDQRFIGKIAVLALGYGGADNAFFSMAEAYGVDDIDEILVKTAVREFRFSRPGTVKFWRRIEAAALRAVKNPGLLVRLPCRQNVDIHWYRERAWLACILPSGRIIRYAYPRIGKSKVTQRDCLVYEGMTSQGQKWVTHDTWGGKLTENVDQGIAGDTMMEGSLRLEEAGYPAFLTVHDEVLTSCAPERAHRVGPIFLMQEGEPPPPWMLDLPFEGKVWQDTRYTKA